MSSSSAGGEHGADDAVALGEVDADEAALAGAVGVVGERALLDDAALGGHDEEAVLGEVLHAKHGGDLFALGEPEEGGDGLALRGAGALGDVVDLLRMALADAGEEEDVVVRRGGEEVLHEVLLVGLGADDALAAALLRAVVGDGGALDEAEVGDGDDAALVGDDVLHAELAGGADDLGAAGRGVFRLHLAKLLLDQGHEHGLGLEDRAELRDELHQGEVFGLDLAALETGELVEAKLEDGVGLALGERILRHQLLLGLLAVLRGADDFDEVVEVIEGDDVALEDVGAVEASRSRYLVRRVTTSRRCSM
jgi:hypothetical protein